MQSDTIEKAIQIAESGRVRPQESGGYLVESQTTLGTFFSVTKTGICNCPRYFAKASTLGPCKHALSCYVEFTRALYSFRSARTLKTLDFRYETAAAIALTVPPGLRKTLRHEYARVYSGLMKPVEISRPDRRKAA